MVIIQKAVPLFHMEQKAVLLLHPPKSPVVRTIVVDNKKGIPADRPFMDISRNPLISSHLRPPYYFTFDIKTTVSTWHDTF